MSGRAARTGAVPAEWALWGKEQSDREYRLLDCSTGAIGAGNFAEVIQRYAPGTPDRLPEVTISWLQDNKEESYSLGIAIHDEVPPDGRYARPGPVPSRTDALGRPTVLTSYYCMPFQALAADAIGYRSLFDAFARIRLPEPGRKVVGAELGPAASRLPRLPEHACRAAALLLTGQPVCLTGGRDRMTMADRLDFLDDVTALLPYGLRARLSASTWASRSYEEHRIRLFFALSARPGDQVVDLDQADIPWTGVVRVDEYLNWLLAGGMTERAALAELTKPLGFTPAVAGMVADWAQRNPGGASRSADRHGPRDLPTRASEWLLWPGDDPGPDSGPVPERAGGHPLGSARNPSVQQLIRSCAQGLADGDPQDAIEALSRLIYDDPLEEQRRDYQNLIRDGRLLYRDAPAAPEVRRALYAALLPLAFGHVLSYQAFCEVESCADTPAGRPVHADLLAAMENRELDDELTRPLVRLLRLQAAGTKTLGQPRPLTSESLIRLITSPGLRPHHQQLVWQALRDRSGYLDRGEWQEILRRDRYFVPQLRELRTEPEDQVMLLSRLLRLAYGYPLDRAAVADIRRDSVIPASEVLIAAIRTSARYSERNRAEATGLLLTDTDPQPPPGRAALAGGLRRGISQLRIPGLGREGTPAPAAAADPPPAAQPGVRTSNRALGWVLAAVVLIIFAAAITYGISRSLAPPHAPPDQVPPVHQPAKLHHGRAPGRAAKQGHA